MEVLIRQAASIGLAALAYVNYRWLWRIPAVLGDRPDPTEPETFRDMWGRWVITGILLCASAAFLLAAYVELLPWGHDA